MYSLNEYESYLALFQFLEKHYNLTKSSDIGSLLGAMQLVDNFPIDEGLWEDWIECIKKAKNDEYKIDFRIVEQ